MKIVNKLTEWYFKFPNAGNYGMKISGVFLLTLFVLSNFDTSMIRGMTD